MIKRRSFLALTTALVGGAWAARGEQTLHERESVRPEDFGAKGDGVTNDTDAFAAVSAHINRAGGGTIQFRKTTYLVGKQTAASGSEPWSFKPAPIVDIRDLVDPLVIRGNGATLKCAPGLRFGAYDRATGEAVERPMPNYSRADMATPYNAMIEITGCHGTIEIENLELDGSLPELRIGGHYGDLGRQIPAIGLFLIDNHGIEIVRNLHTHHHALDGLEINGDDKRRTRSRIENVISEYNGRQGLSLIGGRGYDFVRCKFNHTGRSAIASAPTAGVDIEAEGDKINRDFTFTDCEFFNNVGCGLLAEAGDSADATFTRCAFIGTTSWSAWPRKPGFRFRGCTVVGSLVNPFSAPDPGRAAQFHDCRFLDDPRLSATGTVYLGGNKNHPIVDMGESLNVLFSHCSFVLTHDGLLPWSWRATYSNCVMRQAAPQVGYPKGKYLGSNTIKGSVDLYNTIVLGSLEVNGQPLSKGLQGGEPW